MNLPLILAKNKGAKVRRPEWRKGAYLQVDEELGYIKIEYGVKDKPPRIIMLLSDYNALDWELCGNEDNELTEENNGCQTISQ